MGNRITFLLHTALLLGFCSVTLAVTAEEATAKFLFDDLQTFVNFPAKTTVGFAPKFTTNRKFFANLISTPAFKEILAKDEIELRKNLVKKLQFCDSAVMNQDLLRDLYDREVDQAKQ
ncbi:hypothetical protein MSG28_002907 [Choristoneura fumiferana]|uniref:Uncharacterized protein n=1 Tax=Choristoneura fumiferana TaxID=7141 RepID=A0ACC0JK32_CHOFU|nr:hypothetical protein MSG28_002907 [Choristoneura fumiferana]